MDGDEIRQSEEFRDALRKLRVARIAAGIVWDDDRRPDPRPLDQLLAENRKLVEEINLEAESIANAKCVDPG